MPDFPLRVIQVMPVSRQLVFEVLDMRKIDEAFSDSLKTPCDVIPIQEQVMAKDITPASLGKRFFLLVASRNPMADWKKSGLCSIGQGELQNLTIVI